MLKPILELLGRLANSLADLEVNIPLAGLGAPRLELLLRHEVVLVHLEQDSRYLRDELRLVDAHEALNTTKESLLVLVRRDHLLKHRSAGVNLLDNLLREQSLGNDGKGAVLGFDTELLGLDVDVDVVEVLYAALLCARVDDPLTKSVVVGATLFILLNDESALEVVGKILGTGPDGRLRRVNGPLNLLGILFLNLLGALVDLAGELVITASLEGKVAVVAILFCAVTGAAVVGRAGLATSLGLLAGTALSLLARLVLLALLGLVLENEGAELETRINFGNLSARLAVERDVAILDVDVGFGVLAFLAEDELGDEAVEVVLQLAGVVGAVDDPAVVGRVGVGLGTQLEAKVLDDIWGKSAYVMGKGCLRRCRGSGGKTHRQEGGRGSWQRWSG